MRFRCAVILFTSLVYSVYSEGRLVVESSESLCSYSLSSGQHNMISYGFFGPNRSELVKFNDRLSSIVNTKLLGSEVVGLVELQSTTPNDSQCILVDQLMREFNISDFAIIGNTLVQNEKYGQLPARMARLNQSTWIPISVTIFQEDFRGFIKFEQDGKFRVAVETSGRVKSVELNAVLFTIGIGLEGNSGVVECPRQILNSECELSLPSHLGFYQFNRSEMNFIVN